MANIVDIAVQAGSFKTLCAALEVTGLMDTLRSPGPWTVFAPHDDAFSQLAAGSLDQLFRDVPRLKEILLYHIVPGQYMAEDVMEQESLSTLQGQDIAIRILHGVMVNEAAVIETDVEADNGVIHVIDGLILPRVETGYPL